MRTRWAQLRITVTAESAEAVTAALLDAGSQGVSESGADTRSISGFFPVSDQLMPRLDDLQVRLEHLPDFGLPAPTDFTLTYTDEEEWAEAWKRHWKPVEFGKRLVVKPTWEQYEGDPNRLVIELDPGMAFGTGGHPTTALCLVALEEFIKPGFVVADIGTGSGILALAAARLGAATVHATDIDELPRNIARENVVVNHLQSVITIHEMDEFDSAAQSCDLVAANILAGTIIELLPTIVPRIKPGGFLIGSGIVEERLSEVLDALALNGLEVLEAREEEIWRAVIARKPA